MRSSFDCYKKIESPDMYLCNPDQRFLCALIGQDRLFTSRFNDLSELSFTVPKIKGAGNSYKLVKTKRLVFVDNIGWFQITAVTETVEGDRKTKSVTAKSHQVVFADRGFVTEERVYMFYNPNDPTDEKYDSNNKSAMPSVVGQLYRQLGIKVALSVGDIEPTQDMKDWTIIYIDPVLQFRAKNYAKMYEAVEGANNVCRSFTASTDTNGYDFMVNQVEQAFEVVFEFNYLYHTIKIKTLENITKPTNIYLAFDNVMNKLDIQENADEIVTVMSCNGGDLDIRSVNPMGTNYIVDFSYYKKHQGDDGTEYPWMSKELIDALDAWEIEFERWRKDDSGRVGHTKGYSKLVEELQELYTQKAQSDADIQYANLKLMDMQTARDKYSDGEDATLNGSGFITAESVAVGAKSLLERSGFHTEPFTDDINIVGHTAGPNATKVIDDEATSSYHYEFKFEDNGTSGTPRSLIEAYIDSEKAEDNATVPLYFMDEDNRSYLKLTVAAEVGVVKDENGFVSDNGTVAIRGTSFNVSSTNGVYTIVLPNGQTITATAPDYYFNYDGTRYKITWGADSIVTVYCYYVSGFDRYTTCAETRGKDGGWYDIWADHIKNDLSPVGDSLQNNIDEIKREMEYISEQCNIEKFIQRKGQALYDELSTYWIEGNYSNNNFATYDETTMAERIELANELMEAAKKDLAKSAQPQYELTVDAINFIKLIEFKPFTDELELGRQITVEKEDGVCYYLALMTLEYDLDKSDTFTMTFSSASKPGDTVMTFADLIKESSSVSRTVSANWSNLTDYARNKEGITDLIMAPLDRTLRAAQNDMVNQQFLVDDTGILGRKWSDDSQTTFDDEQIRIINNTLLFTDDNWETASLALGKIRYGENGETAYGLAADVLIGNLLFGSKMKIANQNGNIALDENGITVRDSKGVVHFRVTPEGDVTIYNYATSGDLDGITETLQGKIQESAAGLRSEFTTTLTEDYTSKDELGEALADYSTTTQMRSAIEQSAVGITTSVSETLKSYTTKDDLDDKLDDYSTTTEMETAIQQVAGSLTAYAKKTEGDETSAFGYTLDSNQFCVWKDNSDNKILLCDENGLIVSGTVNASSGNIGGLLLEQKTGNFINTTEHTKTTKLTITIPRGTPGYAVAYPLNIYTYSANQEFALSELGCPAGAILGKFVISNTSATSATTSGASINSINTNTKSIELNAWIQTGGKGGNLTTDQDVSVDVEFTYYTFKQEQSTYSIFRSKDDTFNICTVGESSLLTIVDTRICSADIEKLATTHATVGSLILEGTTLKCQAMSINFGAGGTRNFEVSIDFAGTTIMIYTDGLLPFDMIFPIKYIEKGSTNSKTTCVLIKQGTNMGKAELSLFNEVENATFLDGSKTYIFQAGDYDGNADQQFEISGGPLISDGINNLTYNCRVGNDLGTYDKRWNTLYAINLGSSRTLSAAQNNGRIKNIYAENIYLQGTAIDSSDRQIKNSIKYLSSSSSNYEKLFDCLKPVSFKYNDGVSGRTHLGMIAQDVKSTMDELGIDGKDFAAYCAWVDEDGNETCGLRYEELIPLAILEIQRLKSRICDLQNALNNISKDL